MLIIYIVTILIAVLIAFSVVLKNYRSLSNIVFGVSLLSTAIVIAGDLMSILQPDLLNEWKKIVIISEAVMIPSWFFFTLSFARIGGWSSVGTGPRILLFLSPLLMLIFIAVPIEGIFYSPEFASDNILFLEKMGYITSLFLLMYSIMSIINLEATLRSSLGLKRWRIKYTLIGVGGIISMNIFYYSHALLYRSINMNLMPVRTGVVLISLFIIGLSLLRTKSMDVEIFVSRNVFYKSLSLLVVGIYLLTLGIIGEGMRYFGPTVGANITTFLGFAGAIFVLSIILSEKLRRRAIVFINKNFYKHKYDYRSQWLLFTQRISLKHSFSELLYAIVEGFKGAMGVKGAAIWLKEKETEEFICQTALDLPMAEMKPGNDIISLLNEQKWILNVDDDNCRKVVAENKDFLEMNKISIMVPLLNVDELLGFIVLGEDLADNDYNYEDYDLLKTLARQASAAILNAKLSEELMEAKEMEAMGKISSFITHDLKNAASMLSLIVQNAEEHIDNPEFQKDAIQAVSNTSEKIKNIIGKLKQLPRKTILNPEYSDLGDCVESVIQGFNFDDNSMLSFKKKENVKTTFDNEEIIKVVLNLIINAIDATEEKGEIKVAVGRENEMAFVTVSDNGCGISREFIEKKLFRPFQTTKIKGLGIGLYQCKSIVEAHEGKLKVKSQEGEGTEFIMYLPIKT